MFEGRWVLCSEAFYKLNPLSNRVTFTAIVPGAYTGEAEMCKKCTKMANFWTYTDWITGKRLKIDGYMLRCVWQALNPLFIHVTFTAIVQGAYPCSGGQNAKLDSLAVAKCLHPQNGWRQRHPSCLTCVSLSHTAHVIDIYRLDVCPSVRQTLVLCRNSSTYRQTVFTVAPWF